jgi:hypothetical protein
LHLTELSGVKIAAVSAATAAAATTITATAAIAAAAVLGQRVICNQAGCDDAGEREYFVPSLHNVTCYLDVIALNWMPWHPCIIDVTIHEAVSVPSGCSSFISNKHSILQMVPEKGRAISAQSGVVCAKVAQAI